jgi:DNA helicase II / ATP-dependent DNA helicase PcrA
MSLIARGSGTSSYVPPAPRHPFVPSLQQDAFLAHLRVADSHLLLEARAGTGKSTTCREGARVLADRGRRSIYACFNQHIAREFQADLPPSCRAATLHSLGFALLRSALGNVQVDEDKGDRLAEKFFPHHVGRTHRRAACRLASLCKSLYPPPSFYALPAGLPQLDYLEVVRPVLLQLAAQFEVALPDGVGREEVLVVVPELLALMQQDPRTIDFDDMVWLPVALNLTAPRSPDVLFVDEAQDLNPVQHAIVDRLCPDGRVVVVGDRFQAIYAWRGADADSIPTLERKLKATDRGLRTFPLTVTRRCPQSHVKLVRTLVPDLDYLPNAIDGTIQSIKPEAYVDWLAPGDMVLCRTNAPLVSAAYHLIRSGTRAFVRGRDIGKGLIALISRLRCRTVNELMQQAQNHRTAERTKLSELRNPESAIQAVDDKVDCLLALCEGAATVDEVRSRAESLFSDLSEENAVILSSVHRAKGLERERILIIRPDLLPGPWARTPADHQQESNLVYVACTRAKRVLAFAGEIPKLLSA